MQHDNSDKSNLPTAATAAFVMAWDIRTKRPIDSGNKRLKKMKIKCKMHRKMFNTNIKMAKSEMNI